MESRFDIVFDGEIRDGVELDEVTENLLNLFKGNTEAVSKLMESSRVFIKKNINLATAKKYKAAFDKTGAVCKIAEIKKAQTAKASETTAVSSESVNRESTTAEVNTANRQQIGADDQEQLDAGDQPTPEAAEPSAHQEMCAECGQLFAEDEMIPYHNSWICAACKPVFVQKMKEGVNLSMEMVYGGFWIRFGAKFIDGLIIGAVNMLMNIATAPLLLAEPSEVTAPAELMIGPMILGLIQMIVGATYTIFFLGRFGATPGKMVCKLKVVTADGEKIGYGRAAGRFFGEFLSAIILYIGYLMVAFDSEKRALHDKICGTRVIRV